jgi:hypothetical protein
MFHRVSDVNLRPIYSCFLERAIHNLASRPDERFARDILGIPRLFADQHHRCALWSFTKNSLSSAFVQVTRSAMFRGIAYG